MTYTETMGYNNYYRVAYPSALPPQRWRIYAEEAQRVCRSLGYDLRINDDILYLKAGPGPSGPRRRKARQLSLPRTQMIRHLYL